jgi:hypothetical protein
MPSSTVHYLKATTALDIAVTKGHFAFDQKNVTKLKVKKALDVIVITNWNEAFT